MFRLTAVCISPGFEGNTPSENRTSVLLLRNKLDHYRHEVGAIPTAENSANPPPGRQMSRVDDTAALRQYVPESAIAAGTFN